MTEHSSSPTKPPGVDGAPLVFESATKLRQMIDDHEVSATEVLEAHLSQIELLNPDLNAIVTLDIERATAAAKAADDKTASGATTGLLHGLPMAHKDLADTAGIRTTYGSPLFSDHVPKSNSLHIDRLQNAGAITVGKTNTPEFGAGSQTFNTIFGATCNPWDQSKTCGGSSGGAAVALAAGMIPLADGSDMGGSLRNPASFCGIVGLRPTPGRVPTWPSGGVWSPWGVEGPMGRCVADVALGLAAMSGPDSRVPLARSEPGATFENLNLERDTLSGIRIGWDLDLGGLPIDPQVRLVLEPVRAVLESLGAAVTEKSIDLLGADEVFQVMRAAAFDSKLGPLVDKHPDQFKDTIHWNIGESRRRPLSDMAKAIAAQARIHTAAVNFFDTHDVLVCVVSQVPPFDITTDWVREVDGQKMDTYIDWMRSCSDITTTGCPAISVPAGLTAARLPVGIQLVAAHGDDARLLEIAATVEAALR